jgi:phospholipid/cholesterol/gamma-HCH transport system permease protein
MQPAFEVLVSRPSNESLCIRLAGTFESPGPAPDAAAALAAIDDEIRSIHFETNALRSWDSTLMAFLLKLVRSAEALGIAVELDALPSGARRLLALATAVPEADPARPEVAAHGKLARAGVRAAGAWVETQKVTTFVGEVALSVIKLVRGRARFRGGDVWRVIQEAGPSALPIVSLISFLVGLILAFVAAVQLQYFGAQIYVADLVALGMAREMGAMMTGIIMAGRTGAAFAAQLGAMTANEEIDALSTFGIPPIDFLVLPRMIALVAMMPLLVLYSDLVGILGGLVVGVTMLDLNFAEYVNETRAALDLADFGTGLFKGAVYGVAIAVAGCLRGMQSGRSSAAVGEATTSAVVTAIVWIVLTSAALTLVYNVLGI